MHLLCQASGGGRIDLLCDLQERRIHGADVRKEKGKRQKPKGGTGVCLFLFLAAGWLVIRQLVKESTTGSSATHARTELTRSSGIPSAAILVRKVTRWMPRIFAACERLPPV